MDEDLAELLRAAFDARAGAAVPDSTAAPAPRFAQRPVVARRRWVAPLAAVAAVLAIGAGVAALSDLPGPANQPAATSPAPPVRSSAAANTVHVRLLNDDGAQYGVGMPVIAYFSRMITDARPLQQLTRATVDGKPVNGAWYFERSAAGYGPIEAHYRLPGGWPAHAAVRLSLPLKGRSAGGGVTYDDSLTLDFRTGARTEVTVNGRTGVLSGITDTKKVGPYRLAAGATTRPGVAVVMEKPGTVSMTVDGVRRRVQYAQRLTYGGEYLLGADWNAKQIRRGRAVTNGSIELLPADAKALFATLQIGDIVRVSGVHGPPLTIGAGYGDWTVPWKTWMTGGLVRTH